jgi:DNA primase
MVDEKEAIVDLLMEVLGDYGLHYENKGQISFNCPVCDDDRDKHNLEINYITGVYKCWSCGDSEDTHGSLNKLFSKYGNKSHKKLYGILRPESIVPVKKKYQKMVLPESYVKFSESNPIYPVRRQAYNYLKSRGITDDIIEKYNIGFCDNGSHCGRIIVPSYDKKGELNYYIARSWDTKTKFKYKNPEAEKDKIIFNERLIDWEKDIYLVEGVFDGFFLDNSIPMLGKHMSEVLFEKLYDKSEGNIIIALDGDAFNNAIKLYRQLNGGRLYERIKIIKLPQDKDVCDLGGNIQDYFIEIKD